MEMEESSLRYTAHAKMFTAPLGDFALAVALVLDADFEPSV